MVDAGARTTFNAARSLSLGATETRSRGEFLAEVAKWEEAALADPTAGVVQLAGRMSPDGIRVNLTNRTRTFLRDVRVDLVADGDLIVTEWIPSDPDDAVELFDAPVEWGQHSISDLIGVGRYSPSAITTPVNSHGVVLIKIAKPAYLTMHMETLRPEETHVSDDDEVVLVMLPGTPPESVTLRWRVTAQDVNDIFEGTCEVPVRALDWRDGIRSILYGAEPVEDREV